MAQSNAGRWRRTADPRNGGGALLIGNHMAGGLRNELSFPRLFPSGQSAGRRSPTFNRQLWEQRLFDDDDSHADEERWLEGDQWDDEEAVTVRCPYCDHEIYEEAQKCPYCDQYISELDAAPERKSWLVLIGVILCFCILLVWIALPFL